ncbi:S8 family serine peptidase [Phosphitispora fastidiosa]|uniref:S8 family serine peptidase n=1 Tax=Phosphitispora fastidiosa TaxID=2837202 RepID=UPI001E4F5A9D|nr:S8 family serine peptidase [Phosphitispora fastidiosa]MBU7008209.1 subtilisin family serine protease [Phosphitispora fastidiosa]
MFLRPFAKSVVTAAVIFSLILYSVVPALAVSFSDISGYWARDSVLRLAALDIVNGYEGRFNPQAGVTRAEFAAMIVRALGLAGEAGTARGMSSGYTDVGTGYWASGSILVAREKGLIQGYSDGTFKPEAKIRRVEITAILVRALDLAAGNGLKEPGEVFTDSDQIPQWAYDAVKIAYGYGLINGYPDGSFGPDRNATRGETAALIEKVLREMGAEFTFYGSIQSVDKSSRLMTLDIHGQSEAFHFRPDTEIRIDGVDGDIAGLKTGDYVAVILDREGYIRFIQEENEETSVIIMTAAGETDTLSAVIAEQGGRVSFVDGRVDLLLADVSAPLLRALRQDRLVEDITADRRVRVENLAVEEESGLPADGMAVAGANPGQSLNVTKKAISAPEFVNFTGSDGKNQVIAIIDTGIDAGHPDLQLTSNNKRKITDWKDFTGEGDIDTSSVAIRDGKNLNLANAPYFIGDITSRSGKIRYGYVREVDFMNVNEQGLDMNFNGSSSDVFAVIAVDTLKAGVYDSVFVDTDNDYDLTDEKQLRVFSLKPEFGSFNGAGGKDRFNFVITEIDPGGAAINIGFDGSDHGTHVAGIAAANGRIKGVAPGAQLMSLKVLDAGGYGDLGTIVEAMSYAASRGAGIINLSMGFPSTDEDGGTVPVHLLNSLTEKFGVVFVIAAGNEGPGLTTVATPGDAEAVLSVGAFSSPEMWQTDYGWDVPNENLWFFSAAGPRRDGVMAPSIVAPGSAVSTVSLRGGVQYSLSEGTSMAAPHVSGAIALLMEEARKKKLNISPHLVKRAVESGARVIPKYTVAEQGYGVLNLTRAWAELLSLKDTPLISATTAGDGGGTNGGIFFREHLPGMTTLYLENKSERSVVLDLEGGSWVSPGQERVNLPAGQKRAVEVFIDVPREKGIYSSFISGDNPDTYDKELEVLTTVINPYQLTRENSYGFKDSGVQNAAQFKRYFFKVPPGAEAVTAKLTVDENRGRSMVYLYNPSGRLVSESGYAGNNPAGYVAEAAAVGGFPSAGVWEAVVYTSAALSAYDLKQSNYDLEVSLKGQDIGKYKHEGRNLIVGVAPKLITPGRKNLVTVQVRDRTTKIPFEGFIEINGMLYFTRGGRATIPAEADGAGVALRIRTVPDAPDIEPWELDFTLPVDNGP